MKVLQVTPRYPPRTGGVETHVRKIAERLVSRDHHVTVASADAGQTVNRTELRNGVRVIRHRGLAPGGAYHVAPGIWRTVRRVDANVVHAHNFHSLPMTIAAAAVKSTPFICTPHYHGGSQSWVRGRLLHWYRFIGQRALDRADTIIAVSEWEREQLYADFDVVASVIPNGVDVDRFQDVEPEHREPPYLLFVGRLEEYKGVQHVIHAMPELPRFDLLIAGEGPYREELIQLAAEMDVEERVEFLGFVDHERLPSLYAGASVFVTLSSFEAYGMTVGEALAAGTPCVVTDSGALRDWTERNAVVRTTNLDPESVADAVLAAESLSTDDVELPTWESVVDSLLTLYHD